MNFNRVFYWAGLTVTQPFNTGVQRVTRCLAVALQNQGIEVIPVKWAGCSIALIDETEAEHFAKWNGPQIRGKNQTLPTNLENEWLIIPEITPMIDPVKIGASYGMKTAPIFYDMIPLKTPEFYDIDTFSWIEKCWTVFSRASVALPISETVSADLLSWLTEKGLSVPFRRACLLSGEIPNLPRTTSRRNQRQDGKPFRILATGSWEPRKNYPCIIKAISAARKITGDDIRLSIVGRHMDAEFPNLQREIRDLARAAGDGVIQLHNYLSDAEMKDLFDQAQATIFGSWVEGFGLPVLESIWQGLPCICHNGSSLAEIAPGGGTVMIDMLDESRIVAGICELISPSTFDQLSHEALDRPLRTWNDYAADICRALERAEFMRHLVAFDPLGF